MEVCTHEKAVFFLPVNILTVWLRAFLAARHTTVCVDIYQYLVSCPLDTSERRLLLLLLLLLLLFQLKLFYSKLQV